MIWEGLRVYNARKKRQMDILSGLSANGAVMQLRGGTRPRTDDGQPGTWHRVVAARGDPATEEQDTHT
jgi:alkylated DNA nucleotide flippase Atl1